MSTPILGFYVIGQNKAVQVITWLCSYLEFNLKCAKTHDKAILKWINCVWQHNQEHPMIQ